MLHLEGLFVGAGLCSGLAGAELGDEGQDSLALPIGEAGPGGEQLAFVLREAWWRERTIGVHDVCEAALQRRGDRGQ